MGKSKEIAELGNAVSVTDNDVSISGDLTVDTSTLFVDSTNNNVGIGTNSPQYKLNVGGDIVADGDGNTRTIGFDFYGALKYNLHIDGTTDADKMFIRKGTTNVATFDTSGNVGIGTSSPLAKLDVASSASVTQARVRNQSTGAAAILFQNSDTGTGNGDGLYLGRSAGINYLWTYENEPLVLATDNLERMRIDSSGRVTMPYQPAFHVSGVGQSTNAHLTNWTHVNTNRGGHFNNSNGRFTAPVSGLYHFFFFFTATDQSTPVYPRLDRNSVKWTPSSMDGLHADSGASADFGDDQSNSGLFFTGYLSAGDYVNAYVAGSSTYYTNGIVFGGHLLG